MLYLIKYDDKNGKAKCCRIVAKNEDEAYLSFRKKYGPECRVKSVREGA